MMTPTIQQNTTIPVSSLFPLNSSTTTLGKRKDLPPSSSNNNINNNSSPLESRRQEILANISNLETQLQYAEQQLNLVDQAITERDFKTKHSQSPYDSFGKKHVILFGTDYKHLSNEYQLQGAEKDIENMYNYLCGTHNIITLNGKSATQKNFFDTIHSLSEQVTPQDSLIIYFAAYGTIIQTNTNNTKFEEGIIPNDAIFQVQEFQKPIIDNNLNILSVSQVNAALERILVKGTSTFLIIDASFHGDKNNNNNHNHRHSQNPTVHYIPILHQLKKERFFPIVYTSNTDQKNILSFHEIFTFNQVNNVSVILATKPENQGFEIQPSTNTTGTAGNGTIHGLLTWALLHLCKEKSLLDDIYNKKEKHVALLFCNFILSESLPHSCFPFIKFKHKLTPLRWDSPSSSSSVDLFTNNRQLVRVSDRNIGTPNVKVVLPSDATGHSGGCLLVHPQLENTNGGLGKPIGLIELSSVITEQSYITEYKAIIRFETTPGAVKRGQLLSIVRFGSAFLSVPIEFISQLPQTLQVMIFNLIQSRSSWMHLTQPTTTPNNTTPKICIQYLRDRWIASYAGQFEIFPQNSFSGVEELIIFLAKYIRFRYLLCYASLPFFQDFADVEFSIIYPDRHQNGDDHLHYLVRSHEISPVYISVLWFHSDGNITTVKSNEILSPDETLLCRFPSYQSNGNQNMLTVNHMVVSVDILCLFVSKQKMDVKSLEQEILNRREEPSSFLLDLPSITTTSWQEHGFCSFVCTIHIPHRDALLLTNLSTPQCV